MQTEGADCIKSVNSAITEYGREVDEEIHDFFSAKRDRRQRKEPDFDEHPQEYRKKGGTSDKGKIYEDLLLTYFAFRLANDDDVLNFELSSNDSELLSLDDVVVTIQRQEGRARSFAFQMKHAEDEKSIPVASLNSTEGDFGIKKYFQDFRVIKQSANYTYVLYTNKSFGNKDDPTTKRKHTRGSKREEASQEFSITVKDFKGLSNFGFRIYSDTECPENDLFNTANDKDRLGCIFRFEIVRTFDVLNQEQLLEVDDFVDFCLCFYLLTRQAGIEGIEQVASDIFTQKYDSEADAFKEFYHVISGWSQSEGAKTDDQEEFRFKVKLTKDVVRVKIAEALLSPYTLMGPVRVATDKSKLFEEALSRFDITIINNSADKNDDVGQDSLWAISSDFSDLDQVNQVALKYIYIQEATTAITDIDSHQLTKILWHMGKVPLIVKASHPKSVIKAIEICKEGATKRSFVLIGPHLTKDQFPQDQVFENLGNFPRQDNLYERILHTFTVLVQGRGPVTLAQVFQQEHHYRVLVTSELLLQMVFRCSCIGEDLELMPEDFVNVSLLKNLISLDFVPPGHSLVPTDDGVYQWIGSPDAPIEELRPYHYRGGSGHIFDYLAQLNVICGDTGMGKSVMLNYLKNNYDSKFWIVKINLRDHYKKFLDGPCPINQVIEIEPNGVYYSDFEHQIKHMYFNRRAMVVLWNGVDEVPPICVDTILDTILQLKESTGLTQWVAARSNLTHKVETKLNVFALMVQPLDVYQQHNFIENALQTLDVKCDVIREVYQQLSIIDPVKFFSVVHNVALFTELIKCGVMVEQITPELCCRFVVEKKFEHYHHKSNADLSNNAVKVILRGSMRYRHHEYEKLAITLLLGEDLCQKLWAIDCSKFLSTIKNGDHLGLVIAVDANDRAVFAHDAYVWYFAGRWWAKYLESDAHIRNCLEHQDYHNVVTIGRMVPQEMLLPSYPRPERIDFKTQSANEMR